jgi:hypothetical protein
VGYNWPQLPEIRHPRRYLFYGYLLVIQYQKSPDFATLVRQFLRYPKLPMWSGEPLQLFRWWMAAEVGETSVIL